jgi:hypothetical protein
MNFNFAFKRFSTKRRKRKIFLSRLGNLFVVVVSPSLGYSGLIYFGEDFMFEEFSLFFGCG